MPKWQMFAAVFMTGALALAQSGCGSEPYEKKVGGQPTSTEAGLGLGAEALPARSDGTT